MSSATRHEERLQLHSEGKSNYEISQILGVKQNAITAWVRYHGLQPNKGKHKTRYDLSRVEVSEMPLRERQVVGGFLRDLLRLCERAKRVPDKEGIARFIDIWREKGGVA